MVFDRADDVFVDREIRVPVREGEAAFEIESFAAQVPFRGFDEGVTFPMVRAKVFDASLRVSWVGCYAATAAAEA